MTSFVGDFSCKADSKCRVVVPASFRKVMTASQQTTFVLRRNVFERCLDMYSCEEWEKLTAGLRGELNLFNQKHASFFRELYRGTQEVEMDANGRILLPKRLLEDVGIEREMILAGQDTKIEIWNEKLYRGVMIDGKDFAILTDEIFSGDSRSGANKKGLTDV